MVALSEANFKLDFQCPKRPIPQNLEQLMQMFFLKHFHH